MHLKAALPHTWHVLLSFMLLAVALWHPDADVREMAYAFALALMGPLALFFDNITMPPDTRQGLWRTIAVRAVGVATPGLLISFAPHLLQGLIGYTVMICGMHFLMLFSGKPGDRLSESAKFGIFAGFIVDAAVLYFVAIKPAKMDISLLVMAWAVVSLISWKLMAWHLPGVTPLSKGQHEQFWARTFREKSPQDFWSELHRYLREQDYGCSQQVLGTIVDALPRSAIEAYFNEVQWTNDRVHVQDAYDRLALAAKKRLGQFDPRISVVWELYPNDWPMAMAYIRSLDKAPNEEHFPLPSMV